MPELYARVISELIIESSRNYGKRKISDGVVGRSWVQDAIRFRGLSLVRGCLAMRGWSGNAQVQGHIGR